MILSTETSTFAYDVVSQIHTIVLDVSKEAGIKARCNALAAALANVKQYLENSHPSSDEMLDDRTRKLLDNLEKWPNRPSPLPRDKTVYKAQYEILSHISAKKLSVKRGVKSFALTSSVKDWTRFVTFLRSYAKSKAARPGPELSDLESKTSDRSQDDYHVYVRSLYKTLAEHCLCPHDDGRREITVNLRLNNCCSPGEVEGTANFRLFFLDHPHCSDEPGSSQWQDTRICVSRKRMVKMMSKEVSAGNPVVGRPISVDTFCDVITNRNRSQLQLTVTEGGLVLEGPGPLSRDFLLGVASVSLADLIRSVKMTRKSKLFLAYILANALWQFYDSGWMQKEWTKETVHFMFEQDSTTSKGIFINRPFLSARFGGDKTGQEKDPGFRSHQFPNILALGILILEIELGIDIKDHRKPEDFDRNGNPTVNADHIAADEVFTRTEWDELETFVGLTTVIKTCLYPDHFQPFIHDRQELRDAIQRHIVSPLRLCYENAWKDPATASFRPVMTEARPVDEPLPVSPIPTFPASPIPYHSPVPYRPLSHIHPFSLSSPYAMSPSPGLIPDSVMSASARLFSSDDWFQKLDELNYVLRAKPKEKGNIYQPIKVAIIDTGVDENLTQSIKGYKDFVTGQEEHLQDSTGHGTSAIYLVQKVYHMAEIYVARVFQTSQATANTLALMAQAIRHAKNEWKANILIIPSGFQSDDSDLEKAIDEARSDHILIFAAASNYSNFADIAFPGRLYLNLKLLCMFSTDASIRASPSFNPSALDRARYNFAILGENITHPLVSKPLSGTSFSTVIGAGVAARLLDFSRQLGIQDRIRRIDRLSTVEGMSEVFNKMSKEAVDNGYHCIAPWKILPPELDVDDQDPAAKRLRQRTDICETISRALETIYGR
ncbi:subtilisin-like protein [Aspergillus japonicus CBS 114.51]|uniref:Subtilisin-like protein n=1 Tax=Aspergillus japonicus CBS 114.51 TaxID=1448312 RepID=A0A8T8WW25_ASPJA|nr:subtilisin-like protein [Aspergillus japonicus CBS 114.51]RAH79509.1 subtilisin-like protein [Aspergillus japonicus CBS 114.51]